MTIWRVGTNYGIHIYDENDIPIATFHRAEDAMKAVQAVNNMPRNPYLPPAPDDGIHVYWDGAVDIGGNYRCKLCGAYKGSDESQKPCLGEFKESGKMRVWAREMWAADLDKIVRIKEIEETEG